MKTCIVILAVVILLSGCARPNAVPQPTPFVQVVVITQLVPAPTLTPYPTYTPYPTHTPPPTYTSAPPCDTVQFDVLKSPASIQVVKAPPENVELTWRVRNKATTTSCQWGEAGQETTLLRAVSASEQASISAPVKLTWKADNEYDLSLKVQLGWGSYTLRWRLVLPNADQPAGPELQAKVNVVPPAPAPTLTRTPTITPCPPETYQCNCRMVCGQRDCKTVCDECTRQRCR
jgi:methionine-rich copper-binding protein CopC